ALFVPASGAASRMFESLQTSLAEGCALEALTLRAGAGDRAAEDTLRFVRHWRELALAGELEAELARRRISAEALRVDCRPLLESLLHPPGLACSERPKALIPFHGKGPTARTALEEHLVEAAAYTTDTERRCRVHFTISREHLPGV